MIWQNHAMFSHMKLSDDHPRIRINRQIIEATGAGAERVSRLARSQVCHDYNHEGRDHVPAINKRREWQENVLWCHTQDFD